MKKITDILKDNKLYIFLLITMTFLGIFIRMNYATDTYSVIGDSHRSIYNHFMLSGRFVTAIWFGIVTVLQLSPNMISLTSYLIAIIGTTLALYKLYNIISEDIKNTALSILVSTIIIINPFSVELFMYIERGVMMLAVLMCICALEQFIAWLKGEQRKEHFILAIIFMTIATFSYQGVVALFIALSAVYIIKYSTKFKDFIINNVIMFLCYGIPAVLNLGVVRLFFTNDRVSGNIIFKESLEKVIKGCKNMIATFNIFPKWFFAVLLIIACILAVIVIMMKKTEIKNKIVKVLSLIYVIAITFFITVLPVAMQDTESIWFVSRSTYTFASLLGIIILFAMLEDVNFSKIMNGIMITLAVILLVVQFKRFNTIEIDFYNKCYMEKMNALEIGEMIKEYENETGIKVTNMSVYADENTQYTFKEIFMTGDINVMGFATGWSDINMINHFNNLELKRVDNSSEIAEKFKGKDWDSFDKEEVIFEGDTIHFCRF